jgi:hypothetical protein
MYRHMYTDVIHTANFFLLCRCNAVYSMYCRSAALPRGTVTAGALTLLAGSKPYVHTV